MIDDSEVIRIIRDKSHDIPRLQATPRENGFRLEKLNDIFECSTTKPFPAAM
jgi:hypothetical protein